MFRVFSAVALVVAFSTAAFAQGAAVATRTETASGQITAIDQKTRSITLKTPDGAEETFTAGPEITRFDQLKVGGTIKATYHESLVMEVRKPGAKAPGAAAGLSGSRLPNAPGGTVGAAVTVTVTVKAIDMKVPSITVATADGRSRTRVVADRKNLEGIKVGDTIDITYTQSLMVAADAAK